MAVCQPDSWMVFNSHMDQRDDGVTMPPEGEVHGQSPSAFCNFHPKVVELEKMATALQSTPRYVRVTLQGAEHVTLVSLQKELASAVLIGGGRKGVAGCSTEVEGTALPDFFALPSMAPIGALPAFASGQIVGLDLASGVSVHALLHDIPPPPSPVAILDLCCAPGGKLLYVAELLQDKDCPPGRRIVTGIDISAERLAQCAAHVRRARLPNVHLLEGDATVLAPSPPPATQFHAAQVHLSCLRKKVAAHVRAAAERRLHWLPEAQKRGKASPLECASSSKRLYSVMSGSTTSEGSSGASPPLLHEQGAAEEGERPPDGRYCRVLVDVECSSDASLPHLRRLLDRQQSGKEGPARYEAVTSGDTDAVGALQDLQRQLIAAGYRSLQAGGRLAYVTCSMQQQQNEDVVMWLLRQHPEAQLVPVFTGGVPALRCGPDGCMARLDPTISHTSGLFIASVVKPQRWTTTLSIPTANDN
eukprot:GGOE01041534.1.p1 GENE.GGOE01041534.1~~GGOE01041534.1.p1  ORF type:complete len:474 (+),score=68.04 GGOE01041534.1:55-1476(+)